MKFPLPKFVSLWLLCAVLWIGCSPPQEELPAPVFGRWVTDDPRYEDRYFDLSAEGGVVFGLGRKAVQAGELLSVESEAGERGSTLVELTYASEDGSEHGLSLLFDPEFKSFRFANDKVLWTRAVPPQ